MVGQFCLSSVCMPHCILWTNDAKLVNVVCQIWLLGQHFDWYHFLPSWSTLAQQTTRGWGGVGALLWLSGGHWSIFRPEAPKRWVTEKIMLSCQAARELPLGAIAAAQWLTKRRVRISAREAPIDRLTDRYCSDQSELSSVFRLYHTIIPTLLDWSKFAHTPISAKTRAFTNCWVARTLPFSWNT